MSKRGNVGDEVSARPAKSGVGRFVWRWFKRILWSFVLLVLLSVVGVFLGVRYYEQDLPDTDEIRTGRYKPHQVTRVLARDGTLLAELFTERRTVVSIDSLPPHVKLAILAAEDAHFYEHEGLNYLGMLRAVLANMQSGRTRQGASTITQQVVKNTLLDPERTYSRKIREAILARRIEQELSKDQIFELYINQMYMGHGRYGIEEAARYYFGCSASVLTLSQAATLAGIITGPEIYSPRKNFTKANARRLFVLNQMQSKGFITDEQKKTAKQEPVVVAAAQSTDPELAPEVVEIARRTLQQVVGESASLGGFTITTTIDPKLQDHARKAVRSNLENYDARHGARGPLSPPKKLPKPGSRDALFQGTPRFENHKILVGSVTDWDDEHGLVFVQVGDTPGVVRLDDYARYNPKNLPPSKFASKGTLLRVSLLAPRQDADNTPSRPTHQPQQTAQIEQHDQSDRSSQVQPTPLRLELGPESALVAIDVRTREVLALIGNYEAVTGGLDRATQSRRQPASTFKPFVYSYALHTRQFTAATLVDTRKDSVGKIAAIDEDSSENNDMIRLREALAKSINASAIRVAQQIGLGNVVTWAKQFGITSTMEPDLSLPLGSYEVRPIEMANAYATFASGGVLEPPKLVTRIQDASGRDVMQPAAAPPRRVMDENEAFLITSLLTSVVDHGTGKLAKSLGRTVAGKTGTSNESKDTWFVGYSTDIAVAVWTGYDDAKPLGKSEAGATAALPAWVSFMKAAHAGKPPTDFPRPSDIVIVAIDPKTGLLPRPGTSETLQEYFLRGTEPTEVAGREIVDDNPSEVRDETQIPGTTRQTVPPVSPAQDDEELTPTEPASEPEIELVPTLT